MRQANTLNTTKGREKFFSSQSTLRDDIQIGGDLKPPHTHALQGPRCPLSPASGRARAGRSPGLPLQARALLRLQMKPCHTLWDTAATPKPCSSPLSSLAKDGQSSPARANIPSLEGNPFW